MGDSVRVRGLGESPVRLGRGIQLRYGTQGKTQQHKKGQDMTRKHYQAIANIVRELGGQKDIGVDGQSALFAMTRKLADMMEEENPRFDRARFVRACGFGM